MRLGKLAFGITMVFASMMLFLITDANAYVSPGFNGYETGRSYNTIEYYKIGFKTNQLGKYEVAIDAYEIPSNEWLPIIDSSYFKTDSLSVQTEVDNLAPSAVYSAQGVVKVDVVIAISDFDDAEGIKNYISSFSAILNESSNNVDAHVQELESAFNSEFALHTTWDTVSDMDTHIRLYDTSGRQIEYIWYGNKTGTALTLDKDDVTGGNSRYQNYTSPAGTMDGEWFTIDFPNLPSNASRMEISIVAYRGTARTTVSLVDKLTSQIVTQSTVNLTYQKQEIRIGTLQKNGDSWDFIKANGEVFKGTSAEPLGETLEEASWRDGSIRFVINAVDTIPEECQSGHEADFAYTVTKLLNSNAYLINLGRNTNKQYLDKILQAIQEANGEDSKGTFINSSSGVQSSMRQAANYILEIAKQFNKPTDWVLVNTEIKWNTIYKDSEKDPPLNLGEHNGQNAQPQDKSDIQLAIDYGLGNAGQTLQFKEEKILAEKWRYRHYNNFFDNSPIQVTYHMVWIEDPISIFEYPGKYRINYKRRDNPLYPNISLEDAFDSYRYWSTDYDYKTNND